MGPESNGDGRNGDGRVIFGEPGHEIDLPNEHAARVLTLLRQREPAKLAALIGEAYVGVKPQATRAKG